MNDDADYVRIRHTTEESGGIGCCGCVCFPLITILLLVIAINSC
jgi:hypothetical protein